MSAEQELFLKYLPLLVVCGVLGLTYLIFGRQPKLRKAAAPRRRRSTRARKTKQRSTYQPRRKSLFERLVGL